MFFSEIKKGFADYAHDTAIYNCHLQMEKIMETLEKNAQKLFQWFYNKANPEKGHFLTNNSEKNSNKY